MTTERMKFSKRLNSVLDEAGFPEDGEGRQAAIANLLDVTSETVGLWLEGLDFPQTSKLVKLAKLVHVRSNWLMSGVGEKTLSEASERAARELLRKRYAEKKRKAQSMVNDRCQVNLEAGLSKEALELACAFMKLDEQQQATIKNLMKDLVPH